MKTAKPDYSGALLLNADGKSVAGRLEGIVADGSVTGWVVDLESPQHRVRVVVFCDERLIGFDIAKRPRTDIHGEHYNGFMVALPPDLFDGELHLLEVYAEPQSGGQILVGTLAEQLTKRKFADAPAAGDQPTIPVSSVVNGYVDGLVGTNFVRGWAVANDPQNRLVIRAYEAGKLLAVDIADRPRADVLDAGFGDGRNGFYLMLPRDVLTRQCAPIEIYAGSESDDGRLLGVVECGDLDASAQRTQPNASGATSNDDGLTAAKVPYLEDSLVAAMARIAEVERSERELIAERDILRSRLNTINNAMANELDLYGRLTSYEHIFGRAGEIVRTASLTKRRDFWLSELSALGLTGNVFGMFPHDGMDGELAILVCGSGGIGDALYLSSVVRELYHTFRPCRLFVLHDNSAAEELFRNNPYVSGVMCLKDQARQQLIQAAHSVDIFDLVAEVRYAVTYTAPPLSRIDQKFFKTAAFRSSEWQRFIGYGWPRLNNSFANLAIAKGLTKLDLVGLSSLLPISEASPLDFFPSGADSLPAELVDEKYVTIHHGSDHKMARSGGMQTKNLPSATWNVIVALLHRAGFKVVQLGTEHEQGVLGVDLDLRGKLSLDQSAAVIKAAAVHVDTEGGLVHLARAMHTRSVVAFGPTPVGFFGYAKNDNVAAPVCGNCWWTSPSWSMQCPRNLPEPECMLSHSAEDLVGRAIAIAKEPQQYELRAARTETQSGANLIHDMLATVSANGRHGALVVGPNYTLEQAASAEAFDVTVFGDVARYSDAARQLGKRVSIMPFSHGYIPHNTGSLDWACAIGFGVDNGGLASICAELVRCVRRNGKIVMALDADSFYAAVRQGGASCVSSPEALGKADAFNISPQLEKMVRESAGASGPIFVEIVQRSSGSPEPARKSGRGNGQMKGAHATRD